MCHKIAGIGKSMNVSRSVLMPPILISASLACQRDLCLDKKYSSLKSDSAHSVLFTDVQFLYGTVAMTLLMVVVLIECSTTTIACIAIRNPATPVRDAKKKAVTAFFFPLAPRWSYEDGPEIGAQQLGREPIYIYTVQGLRPQVRSTPSIPGTCVGYLY